MKLLRGESVLVVVHTCSRDKLCRMVLGYVLRLQPCRQKALVLRLPTSVYVLTV